jgi:uncharacterized protein (DUF3084 family)
MALAVKIKSGKFDRIPKIYSEELWRVITLMLHSNQEKRPSVDDLLNIPHVSLRLREKRLKEHFSKLKRREEEVKAKEIKIVDLENELLKQKEEMKQRLREIEEREKQVKLKEEEVADMKEHLQKKKKQSTPPLVTTDTPKPIKEKEYKFKDDEKYGTNTQSIYHSLKQEIRELSNQVNSNDVGN